MRINSKEALKLFAGGVRDSALLVGVLLLLVAVGTIGISLVYCWHEVVLKLAHWCHHR